MSKKVIITSSIVVILLILVGFGLWQFQYNMPGASDAGPSREQTKSTVEKEAAAAEKDKDLKTNQDQSDTDQSGVKLPWLTRSQIMEGKLDDNTIHLGDTAAQLTEQLGEPEMKGNYEGAYYGYGDAAFFFARSLPEEIRSDDKIVKLMLSVKEHQLTRSFMKERFGNPASEGVYGGTDDYLIYYEVGPYMLVATPEDSASKNITVLELSEKKE